MSSISLWAVLTSCVLFTTVQACMGQGPTGQNATGTKPFWTYLQNREVVSPSSGNVMVTIPLLHLPGRDGHDLNVSLTYNSQSDLSLNETVTQAPPGNGGEPGGIVRYSGGTNHWRWNDPTVIAQEATFFAVNYSSVHCQGNYSLKTAGGASYTFGAIDTGCQQVGEYGGSTPISGATIPVATDDSQQGVIFDALAPAGPTAYFPDGKRIIGLPSGAMDVDANGNYITYVYTDPYFSFYTGDNATITDTLGRQVSEVTHASGQKQLQYYNSEGVQQTININFGGAPPPPHIILPGPVGMPTVGYTGSGQVFVPGEADDSPYQISSIVFPDGSSYSFQYDDLGDLLKIGYPGGGYTRYEYNILAPRLYWLPNVSGYGSSLTAGVSPQLSAKYTCADTGIPYGTVTIPSGNTCSVPELTTTYLPNPSGAYNIGNVVTEPDGTSTTYSFDYVYPSQTEPGSPGGILSDVYDRAPIEISHTVKDSSGNVLEQVSNTYESDAMHLRTRSTSRLHGVSTLETWNNVSAPLTYAGANLVNGMTYPAAQLSWTVQSLTTTDLNTGVLIKREDYTWVSPPFDPASPYFDALKVTDSLFDPAVGGYTVQTQSRYDETPLVSSNVASSSTYYANSQRLAQSGLRGNITSSLRWSSDDNDWIGSHHVYDDAGNVVQTTDARGYTTTYSYTDQWFSAGCLPTGSGPTAAYVTSVRNALGQSASAVYNPCTGTIASKTDPNNNPTTYSYWPTTDQLASVGYPDGGSETLCYENTSPCPGADVSARNYTLTTVSMSPDPPVVNQENYDGLGRRAGTELLSDPWCTNNGTETYYNSREWVSQTTFPHCSGAVGASTLFQYNGLGYVVSKQVTGSVARTWNYNGQSVTETDEVGNKTVSTVDSLGRLAQVMEPGPTNAPAYETDYQYDAANNLKQVDQWGGPSGSAGDRQRTFIYDTLSRLKTSNNPEVNSIGYGYDRNGNLVTETDARNITAKRSYDALNRLIQTTYSDGTPTECFAYDTSFSNTSVSNPLGRLVADWTQMDAYCSPGGPVNSPTLVTERLIGVSNTSDGTGGYDTMGRLTADMQCPSEPCPVLYPSKYTYNMGGVMNGQTLSGLPSGGLTLSHGHDGASRLSLVTSSWSDGMHPATIFEADANTNSTVGVPYGPFGLLNGIYGAGSSTFGYATSSRSYDSHGRSQSETDTAAALTSGVPAATATGAIDITMNEQFTPAVSTHSTATITITSPSGGDQYSSTCNCYATGSLGLGIAGTNTVFTLPDGPGNTTASIAAMVAAALNSSQDDPQSLVTATVSGSVVTLTSTATGPATNYSLYMIDESTNPQYFPNPSFVPVPSGPTMTGGVAGTGTAISDSGTITATVGALAPVTLSWNVCDTAITIAARLATLMNSTPAYAAVLSASANGSQVILSAMASGSAGNMTATTSVTYNTANFGYSSVAASAVSLTGGVNGANPHGTTLAYQYTSAQWQDNGSLGSVTDTIMGQQAFQYDRLNRLVGDTIQGPAGNGALSWSYDPFGNRQSQSSTGQLSFPMTQMTATYQRNSLQNGVAQGVYSNRMDGVNHDLSGNVLGDPVAGQNFYSYDAGSRLQSAGSVCYVYNAEGIRTAKGNTLVNGACTNITAQYILGPGGEQVTELSGQANNPVWAHTNVFGGDKLLATYDNAGTHFHFTDWLGTMRAQVNADGTLEESCLSLPFGDALSCSGPGSDATEHHFTGKERDAESGLDYFGARYFQSNAGRWMSPDWAAKAEPIPYAKLDFPQTLNLYAYVENNPLSMADADGHCGTGSAIPCGEEQDRIADSENAQEEARNRQTAANAEAQKQKPRPPQAQQLVNAQNAAMANGKYQPTTDSNGKLTTHCSEAACAIAKGTGANLTGILYDSKGKNYDANTQIDNLANSSSYHVVTPEQAQALGDNGTLVFGTQHGARHGHIASVRPEGVPGDNPRGRSGPLLANVGEFNGVAHQSAVMTPKHGAIVYYAPNQ